MLKKQKKHLLGNAAGYISLLVLIFSAVFIVIITGLSGFIALHNKLGISKVYSERALNIAEAGLNYYKWFLAHNPNDTTNGTGGPGPYTYTYDDPTSGTVGDFSLEVDGNVTCNQVTAIDITSTGWVDGQEQLTRTVKARYARPSVAEYAFIVNSDVWAGSDRNIYGKYHSNGGIRMDGTNNSLVTSAVSSWLCTNNFNCDPDQTVNGVFGAGPNSNLWQYPDQTINFSTIVQSISDLKSYAQTGGGLYFAPSGGTQDQSGYRLSFKSDGTVDVYKVTGTDWAVGYSSKNGWAEDYNTITSESFVGNYSIPPSCNIIFVEDKMWIEGTVNGKVTVVAADTGSYDPDIILQGNINYATLNGTTGLTAIAEGSVLIPLVSPDTMSIRGIFVAQNGRFGRNYYSSSYYPYDTINPLRSSLSITGSIISNGRVGTKWSCSGTYCSGYASRTNSYDRNLAQDPPPFTPSATTTNMFIKWEEVE